MLTVPAGHRVAVYPIRFWRWREMRHHLDKLNRDGGGMVQWIESGHWPTRIFTVTGRLADIYVINYCMGLNDYIPELVGKQQKLEKAAIIFLLAVALGGFVTPLFAGDRDHVGGAASPAARAPGESPSGNPTNYSLRTPHVTTFSEWLGSLLEPRSGINPGTVYNGTAGDSMHSGPGIGSWGSGGGTGPGARGY